ncbi:hypothetical protein NW768_011802 [Fusarium equiseti]|uniref:Ankyrin repeat protein n=1 Tax=Fusarium equiseti TaxID=61235 RepID=A0ABQ8QVZ1_FUSEQ|nr:hypothetical protein NW768_011802 [Fusarium equiseti]
MTETNLTWINEDGEETSESPVEAIDEDVLTQPGIEAVALDLLHLVSKLRSSDEQHRELIFVCHDVGGIILKNALTMAVVGTDEFRELATYTHCIIFHSFDTTMSFSSSSDWNQYYEEATSSPHSSIGGEGIPWYCKWFLTAAIATRKSIQNKRVELSHLASEIALDHMSLSTSISSGGWKQSSNISTIQPVLKQRDHGNAKYFSVLDPVSGYATALAIYEHFSDKSDLRQFFEFRDWDARCNDINSMLCKFLAEIPMVSQLTSHPVSVVNSGTKYHGRSRTLLFNIFYDYLLRSNVKTFRFTWVLLNFDERVDGYSWLMSLLCDLLRDSELNFTLVIVNKRPVDLSAYSDCFESVVIHGREEVDPQEELIRNLEHRPDGCAAETDTDLTVAPDVSGLLVEYPSLYKLRPRISKLLLDCQDDADLRRLVVAFIGLRTTHSAPPDINRLLDRLFPITPETIFEHLWQPPQPFPEIRQHICWATNILLVSYRPLTLTELYDLEARTGYGESIGLVRHAGRYSTLSPRTVPLLQGIVSVRNDEVRFSHDRFRDWVQSRINQESKDPNSDLIVGEMEGHYRMSEWCVQRIQGATKEEWAQCQTENEHLALPELRNTFLRYAVKYWPKHASMSGMGAGKLLFLEPFLRNHDAIQNWVKAYWSLSDPMGRGPLADMTHLTVLAGFGSEALVNAAIDISAADFSSSRDKAAGALVSAMRGGHPNVIQRLLELHPLQDSDVLNDLLLRSFSSNMSELSSEALQIVINDPRRLKEPITTLALAAYYGLEKAVEMLIAIIPTEATKEDGYLPTYLAVTSSKLHGHSCLKIIDRLIQAGYPLKGTIPNKGDSNAFHEACKTGNRQLALSLVEYLPEASSTLDGELEAPADFLSGIEAAIENGHYRVVDGLLELALAKHWTNLSAIGVLISDRYSDLTPICSKALISHLFALLERSSELSTEDQSILYQAFKSGAFPILPRLLKLPLGPMVAEFPGMLDAIVQADWVGVPYLPSLLEFGKMACDPQTYEETLALALGSAVYRVKTNMVEELLKHDPPLNTRSFNDNTPLFIASYNGSVDLGKILIAAGADVNAEGNETGWTALHAAYDNANMSRILLQAHADPNAKEPTGKTALFYACRNGHTETVQVLLEHGAQVGAFFERDTELSVAVWGGHTEIVELLLASGTDPRQYSATDLEHPLLHTCVKENDAKTLKVLLLHDVLLDEKDDVGNTPLQCIDYFTNVELVQLLGNRGASLELLNEGGWTPLAWATGSSNYNAVEWLVKKGASLVTHVESYGSLIHIACHMGNIKIVKLLHSKGLDINTNDPGISGTPLHALLRRSNGDEAKAEIFEYLIGLPDFNLDQSSAWWGGHLATACLSADLSMASTLIAKGLDVNSTDRMGRRPIHAALYRELQFVRLLEDNSADMKATDSMRRCALHFAVVSGRLDVVKHVLEYDKSMVNRQDIDNWTPLMWAARHSELWGVDTTQREDIIKELINNGADLTVQGQGIDRTWTARKVACYYGLESEIVDLLTPGEESPWAHRDNTRKARKLGAAYCDACFMPEHLFSSSDESTEYEDDSSPAGTVHSSNSAYSESAADSSDAETKEELDQDGESTAETVEL